MDALPPSAIRDSIKPIPAGMYRGTVGFVIACVSLTALLLLGRRLAGALVEPLATPTLLWIGLLLAGCGAAVRWRLVRQSEGVEVDSRSRFRLIASTVSTVATLAFAGAVSLPGTSTTGLVCLWFPVVAGELGWLINLLIGKRSAQAAIESGYRKRARPTKGFSHTDQLGLHARPGATRHFSAYAARSDG